MKNAVWALAFPVLFLLACRGPRPATVQPENAGPEILFLQLEVWKKDSLYGASIRQQRRVKGTLNRDLRGARMQEGYWLVSFLDAGGFTISEECIPNPLEERYETADANGRLRSVEINKPSADCFLRVPYDIRFSQVRIERIGTSYRREPLLLLPL